MFLNDLYTLSEILQLPDGSFETDIIINPGHRVFMGHFPGQPVLPGVCILEMLKDIVKKHTGKEWKISQASSVKYLKVVDPTNDTVLRMQIGLKEEADSMLVSASSFTADGSAHFKFKGRMN